LQPVLKQVKMLVASKIRLLLYSPARRNWQTHRGEDFKLHSLMTRMSGLRSDLGITDETSSSIFRKY